MSIDVAYEVLTDPDFLIGVCIERKDPGSYVDGLFISGTSTELNDIQVSLQPMTANDFVNAPEGERAKGDMTMYSRFKPIGTDDLAKADTVKDYDGASWKVIRVEAWGHHGFYKSMLSRQQR